jgi:transformation/transcription domain-associated protein
MLRALFRSIGGGKFEALYKEFLPILPTLLEYLNKRMKYVREPDTEYMHGS